MKPTRDFAAMGRAGRGKSKKFSAEELARRAARCAELNRGNSERTRRAALARWAKAKKK